MKHGGLATWEAMRAMIERVDASLAAVEPTLPADFPEHVWETIAKGVRSQAARFRQTFKD
jgi:serine/threonine-protein kinase HipA